MLLQGLFCVHFFPGWEAQSDAHPSSVSRFYSCAAGAIQISAGCKMILIQGRVCFAYSIQKS